MLTSKGMSKFVAFDWPVSSNFPHSFVNADLDSSFIVSVVKLFFGKFPTILVLHFNFCHRAERNVQGKQ